MHRFQRCSLLCRKKGRQSLEIASRGRRDRLSCYPAAHSQLIPTAFQQLKASWAQVSRTQAASPWLHSQGEQQERTELGGEPIMGEQQFPHVPDCIHPPRTSGSLSVQPLSTMERTGRLAALAHRANCNDHSRTEASFGLRELSSRSRGHRLLLFMGERTPTQIQLSFVMATKTKARPREEVPRAPVPVGSLSSHSPGNHGSVLEARYMVDPSVPALDRSSKSLLWVKGCPNRQRESPNSSLKGPSSSLHAAPGALPSLQDSTLHPAGKGRWGRQASRPYTSSTLSVSPVFL